MKNWKRVIEESGKVEAGRGRGSKKIQSGAGARSGEEIFRRGGAGSKKSTPFRPLIRTDIS